MRPLTPGLAPDEIRPARPAEPAREAPRQARPRPGPGPSKLSYRLARAWAKPMVRSAVLVYLPLALLALAGWRVAAHDEWRGAIQQSIVSLAERIAARPEFAVRGVSIIGGSEALKAEVRRALAIRPGTSSLKLDVEELRLRVAALGPVETASVQLDPQGILRVSVVERIPAVLFRRPDGALVLLDEGGVEIGPAASRGDHPEMPVILGQGAERRVGEALALIAAAPEILPRLRALVRVGRRRWDVHLDRGMVIRLPQAGSLEALARVMALHYGEELLDRDLAVIDMRLPQRPALRMTPEAAETYQIRKAVETIGGNRT